MSTLVKATWQYGKYTENFLLAVLLCIFEILLAFFKKARLLLWFLNPQLAGAMERDGCRNAVTKAGVGQAGRTWGGGAQSVPGGPAGKGCWFLAAQPQRKMEGQGQPGQGLGGVGSPPAFGSPRGSAGNPATLLDPVSDLGAQKAKAEAAGGPWARTRGDSAGPLPPSKTLSTDVQPHTQPGAVSLALPPYLTATPGLLHPLAASCQP